ncbi:hypothetical protein DBR37_03230 [Herminiimonas sp. KBW02]|uniref:reverse transcriptase family protein n=1 Tax=Herminiimonas sp. KBW02 TaxID=2153363 RepID=UPI000F5AC8D7|nr:reverse transcriptase family protein [Herminiimonas sp. KBW02]RQO37215.1 hypothetical protein DBR37_03230 [Herminiimonas sp. KBW02]
MTKNPTRGSKKYDLESSPLYRLSNKRKLADLLGVEPSKILGLKKSAICSQYKIFKDKQTSRFITEPHSDLLLVHRRLLDLLTRIQCPPYLHSARKKHSYKTNAEAHQHSSAVLKIDIRKFFPSVKFHYVYDFFKNEMSCAPDISTILAKLCTVTTLKFGIHLPTGSCISPLLSFLVNKVMFDEIDALCRAHDCKFTLYVDDMTISGDKASRALLTSIAMIIHRFGYGYHKIKTYHQVPTVITGLVVYKGMLRLPHRRAKLVRVASQALAQAVSGSMRKKLLGSLIGRLSEAEQINPLYKVRKEVLLTRYKSEWQTIMDERVEKSLKVRGTKSK